MPGPAQPKSVANPTTVVGSGTPQSCTSQAVVAAVANGGVVTFNCGAAPVTINLAQTLQVFNDKPDLVLDGGGRVTLSGGGARRILYQNTCDANLVWTSTRCDLQDNPKTTLQNLTFVDGNSTGQNYGRGDVDGGGAVFARGGRMSVVNARFFRNQCDATGPDLGGAGLRVTGMSGASPVYIANSTFGGADGYGNQCSNGGGISALWASLNVTNTLISHNKAIGYGANPQRPGTPGGGSGGAIYQDGLTFDLSVCGSLVQNNTANEGGGAFLFVSNDFTGTMSIDRSILSGNPNAGFETQGLPGIFIFAAPGQPVITNSTLSR